MRPSSFLGPLFFAASSLAQAVPEGIAPPSKPPSGCVTTSNGNFTIGTLIVGNKKRETAKQAADGALTCTLKQGVLRDSFGRTGAVVANHQFQFDGPPQAGSIYTGGFSICSNGSLAIGGSSRWWQCSSGGFYNLYDEWIGDQCEEIRIQASLLNQPSASPSASVSASSSATSAVVSIISSLATISGSTSSLAASAVGPSASSQAGNVTSTSAAKSGASSATAAATKSPSSGSGSGSAGSAGASGAAPAPPANNAGVSIMGASVFSTIVIALSAVMLV